MTTEFTRRWRASYGFPTDDAAFAAAVAKDAHDRWSAAWGRYEEAIRAGAGVDEARRTFDTLDRQHDAVCPCAAVAR